MEDKTIIKSERYDVKKIFKYARIFGIIAFVCLFLFVGIPEIKYYIDWYKDDFFGGLRKMYDSGFSFAMSNFFEWNYFSDIFIEPACFWSQVFYSFVVPFALAGIAYAWLKSYELTITNKRAYGFAAFGRRVDLPIDSVSAIGLGWLKSIKITTASGKISFFLIKNRDEMYETMSKLIIERQSEKAAVKTVVNTETSAADELKKYKELLDGDVISQEEFDQKKKQLLGL